MGILNGKVMPLNGDFGCTQWLLELALFLEF